MPRCAEAGHEVQHALDQLGVERAGGLVEEHDLGLHGERAGDRDALLLAAREVAGPVVGALGEPDLGEPLAGRRARASALDRPLTLRRASATFSQRRVVGEQVEVLEHHADALAQRVGLLRQHALAGEQHVAATSARAGG